MTNKLNNFIKTKESEKFATDTGRVQHTKLQHVYLGTNPTGDPDLINKIMDSGDELKSFFMDNSKTEVPIAGVIGGQFVSRRIDRLIIDDKNKIVRILDYKTDTDTEKFRPKYKAQLKEYADLLKQIYPDYKVACYILWLHNWSLEQI